MTDTGDVEASRRRHPSNAYEYEHDVDPLDHADAYAILDDEPVLALVDDVVDVDLGPGFLRLVDDELDRRRTLRDLLNHRNDS